MIAARSPGHRTLRPAAAGFTLIEIMTSLLVLSIVMMGLMLVLQTSQGSRLATTNGIEARQKAAIAMELIEADLRVAGTGIDAGYATPQLAVAYVDSLEILVCGDMSGSVTAPADTLAYSPTGTPKPVHLTGGYSPPIKYRTGAELVRWTLDLNNDGSVNSGDIADANGVDVQRSRNPSDYMLVRQVYGDSLNNVAGDNGGAISRMAPVLKPGGGVPALFTVTMTDGTTWNWSSGAVPANKLANIASIKVQVTAESSRPDTRGKYSRETLSTTISVARVDL